MERDAGGAGSVADLGDADASDDELTLAAGVDGGAGRLQNVRNSTGVGGAHRRARLLQRGERAGDDELATIQHHDLVGEVLDLGEQVAGDEHRAAGGGTLSQ